MKTKMKKGETVGNGQLKVEIKDNYQLSTVNSQLKKGWEYGTLEDAVNKGSSNISLNKIKDEVGEYPVFKAKGFAQNVSFFHQEKEYLAIIKDGAGIGRVSKHPAKSSVVATMQYLIPKEEFDIGFVRYFLNGIDFQKHRKGSTIPHVYFKDYKNEAFPLLPLKEQQQIVAILDKAFAAIATAKDNAQQNLLNAKQLFESYLQNIFENKGDDWEEKRIDEVTTVLNGHSFKSKDFANENSVKSIKITNVGVKKFVTTQDNLPSSFLETYKKYKVFKGNIVIALTRTIISSGLKVAIVPEEYNNSLLNQRVAALIPKDVINDDYLYHFFCTKIVSNYVLSNVNPLMQPNLSITDLKRLLIPCPTLKEQQQIVKKLNNLSAETKKLEVIYQQKIEALEELKKSILQKAFNGELSEL